MTVLSRSKSHVMELFVGVFVLSLCLIDIAVGIRAFVIIYGQKLELVKALKVLNEGFTIGLHVN